MTKREKIEYFANELEEKGIDEKAISEFKKKAKKYHCHRSADYFTKWTGSQTRDRADILQIWNGIDGIESVFICNVS